jgi:5-methylcytosine-specific restriction endonuclease McrA
MIAEFDGNNEMMHDAFQAWRKAHPDGFHLTDKGSRVFSAHWAQDKRENGFGRGCWHQGTSDLPYETVSCSTTAKKVCSESFQELNDWAASKEVTIKICGHCNNKRFPFPKVEARSVSSVFAEADFPPGNKHPDTVLTSVIQYARNEPVRAWVLKNAAGACECCASAAPFRGVDGQPFLEVHHVRRLSDGGTDTVFNTVALCPNCHRQLHHGLEALQLVSLLYAQIGRLVRE